MKMSVNLLKKRTVAAGVFCLAIASSANANSGDCKFYAGAGLDYAKYGINKEASATQLGDDVKSSGMGVLFPVLGMKFNENIGVEFGYSFSKAITATAANGNKSNIKLRNIYTDMMGFMPVMDQVELIGGLGFGTVRAKADENFSSRIAASTSWRIKAGAQYNFTSNIGVRALATYQNVGIKLNDDKFIKNMKSIGLAATYTF